MQGEPSGEPSIHVSCYLELVQPIRSSEKWGYIPAGGWHVYRLAFSSSLPHQLGQVNPYR